MENKASAKLAGLFGFFMLCLVGFTNAQDAQLPADFVGPDIAIEILEQEIKDIAPVEAHANPHRATKMALAAGDNLKPAYYFLVLSDLKSNSGTVESIVSGRLSWVVDYLQENNLYGNAQQNQVNQMEVAIYELLSDD